MAWSSLCGLLLLVLCSSGNLEVGLDQNLAKLNHHISNTETFICHHPQPRALPVRELLTPFKTQGKSFYPEVTVLHQCDTYTGCCKDGKICGPIHAESVNLMFRVTFLHKSGKHTKGDTSYEHHVFNNHTLCGCDLVHKRLPDHMKSYYEDHDVHYQYRAQYPN